MRRGFTLHWNGDVPYEAHCLGRPHSRCEQFWAAVKAAHTNPVSIGGRGWSDIAYSFGVCPHGQRFTGRGWDQIQFANGKDIIPPDDGADVYWYTVLAFIGGTEQPNAEMVLGIKDLIAEGRRRQLCGLRVTPHSDFKPKTCPGDTLRAYARQWDNQPFIPAPITIPEEDDMFMYTSPGKPVFFCSGGVSVGINEPTDMPTFSAAKIPLFKLDNDTFAKFRKAFPGA